MVRTSSDSKINAQQNASFSKMNGKKRKREREGAKVVKWDRKWNRIVDK